MSLWLDEETHRCEPHTFRIGDVVRLHKGKLTRPYTATSDDEASVVNINTGRYGVRIRWSDRSFTGSRQNEGEYDPCDFELVYPPVTEEELEEAIASIKMAVQR